MSRWLSPRCAAHAKVALLLSALAASIGNSIANLCRIMPADNRTDSLVVISGKEEILACWPVSDFGFGLPVQEDCRGSLGGREMARHL